MSNLFKYVFQLILVLATSPVLAQGDHTWVTIYSQNFGLVREVRMLEFKKGTQEIQLGDVPDMIDPTSVHIKSLTSQESISILEQYFHKDVVDSRKLLVWHIDKEIEIHTSKGDILKGRLLSVDPDIIVALQSGEIMLVRNREGYSIKFPHLPEGLVTKPVLTLVVDSKNDKDHICEVEYLTQGLNWRAEYVTVLNQRETHLDINARMNIDNRCGTNYHQARLKLVAGDVNLAQEGRPPAPRSKTLTIEATSFEAGVSEQEAFEYHVYTIERPVDLMNNQLKQVTFFDVEGTSVSKKYVLDSSYNDEKIRVYLRFKNEEKNKLGIPFPAGRFRVYKRDDDGSSIFLGEDRIKHTPKDEWLKIFVGSAFDLISDRKQLRVEKPSKNSQVEAFEIELRNHKRKEVTVAVVEHFRFRMPTSSWKIIASNHEYTVKEARSVEFMVSIPAEKERKLTYSVEYSW